MLTPKFRSVPVYLSYDFEQQARMDTGTYIEDVMDEKIVSWELALGNLSLRKETRDSLAKGAQGM